MEFQQLMIDRLLMIVDYRIKNIIDKQMNTYTCINELPKIIEFKKFFPQKKANQLPITITTFV